MNFLEENVLQMPVHRYVQFRKKILYQKQNVSSGSGDLKLVISIVGIGNVKP